MALRAYADRLYFQENFGSPPAAIADRLDMELARASRLVRAECPGIDDRIESGRLDPLMVADVVCEIVKTASVAAAGGVGVASTQVGAGPFQQTQTYVNPVGDLYLSKKQRRLLGYGQQVAFTVPVVCREG